MKYNYLYNGSNSICHGLFSVNFISDIYSSGRARGSTEAFDHVTVNILLKQSGLTHSQTNME